jgi:hypothetical protein
MWVKRLHEKMSVGDQKGKERVSIEFCFFSVAGSWCFVVEMQPVAFE